MIMFLLKPLPGKGNPNEWAILVDVEFVVVRILELPFFVIDVHPPIPAGDTYDPVELPLDSTLEIECKL
jgi:hypothetical protein